MPTSTRPSVVSRVIATGGARVLGSRRLVRAPIGLYRARLGFLFGSRMLMLEHTGRKSGIRRYVVLEVVDRPGPDTYVVVSGFGTRSQWFRNVQAQPHVRVSVGGRVSVPATARTLAPAEADATLDRYVSRHPRAWQTFKPVVEATLGSPVGDRATGLPTTGLPTTGLPMIGLHLGSG